MTQVYDEALRPTGLRLTQYSVLANVDHLGALSITDLAEHLVMDRTTLTRNLRPLERAGLLQIVDGPNRRSRAVELTSAGRALLAEARPLWLEAEETVRDTVGRQRAKSLRNLLSEASETLRP